MQSIVEHIALTLIFKENSHEYEYRDRTYTGYCNGNIDFVDAEVFKLFRGGVFDRCGYFGANAPIASVEKSSQGLKVWYLNGFQDTFVSYKRAVITLTIQDVCLTKKFACNYL
jgi:hypothetical protein